jgi:hypothetical protein
MSREFLSVHDAHCCPKHGCKYGKHDCPVELGKEPGLRCEHCDLDDEEFKELTGMTPDEFEQLKKDAEAYRKLLAEGKI